MPTARRPPGVTSGAYLDLFDGTECPITSFHECKDCAMSPETKMLRLHLRDEGDFEEYNFGSDKIDKIHGSGWELVMKVDGSKSTFDYESEYWTNNEGFNDDANDDFDLNDDREYKNGKMFSEAPVSEILLGFKEQSGQDLSLIHI